MKIDTLGARWIRGLVKTVFIICYVAFMWASIHHLATFFNDFESDRGNTFGSYLLAGAFDITALVTTIGVMFFRRSMPRSIQWIVWTFIVALAGYSFFVNWEYAAHYQNISLALQQTGETTPVYDAQGVLHYVPVMQTNTNLLWINPILASGFTVFSLIYSVIAEFFGTKPPNVSELVAKKKYLEETSELLNEIKTLEDKGKKPSLIQRAKEVAMEVKSAANEVITSGDEPAQEEVIVEDETEVQPEEESVVIPFLISHSAPVTEQILPPSLGMIEQVMFDKIVEDPTTLIELAQVAQSTDIAGLTSYLKTRFSSHSGYITESRVTNVFQAVKVAGLLPGQTPKNDVQPSEEMDVIEEGETEVFQEEDEPENEPSTDPEMEAANVTHFPETGRKTNAKVTVPLNVIDIATRRKPLTLSEAVQVLGVSEKTVREWKRSGKLSTVQNGKFITASSVREMLKSRVKVS